MLFTQAIKRLARILVRSVFPDRCSHCDRLYAPGTDNAPKDPVPLDGFLCPDCLCLLEPITSPMCVICGRPFATEHGVDHACDRCGSAAFNFQEARAVMAYGSAIRGIVHLYKYQGCAQLAVPLGGMLFQTFRRYWHQGRFDAVVPVPLHRRRLRKRGFNQSALLLRDWPFRTKTNGAASDGPCIRLNAVARHRATPPQAGLDAKARKANMRDAFTVRQPEAIQAKHVLLVDDVLTTGATVNACAGVLMHAGAASVRVITLARAI